VSQLGRNTQGVTLIRLPAEESLVSVVRLDADESNGDEVDAEGSLPPEQGESVDTPPSAE
jgi:DNA gyrase subunit A